MGTAPVARPTLEPSTLKQVSSSFGESFKITTFGESHGHSVGVTIDGCPPLLDLDMDQVQHELDRRRPGQSSLVTQRQEADVAQLLSGTYEGKTTGTPITIVVKNKDQNPGAYDHLKDVYRPSHADFSYQEKYGHRDHRGGGRSSARETVGRVAAGAVARQMLAKGPGIEVLGWVDQVHDIDANVDPLTVGRDAVEATPTRCPDTNAAETMTAAITEARRKGDSLGGVVTVAARKMVTGLGEPIFDRLEADLAKAMLSLPAAKGFDIGSGFAGTRLTGLAHNDPFTPGPNGKPVTTSNNSGGTQGGISNGADVICRVAFKPTATISSPQQTTTTSNEPTTLTAKGRHDPCVLPRAVPVVEAMMLLVLADHWLRQQTTNVFARKAGNG